MTVSSMALDMDGSAEFYRHKKKSQKTIYILGAIIAVLLILTITFISLYASKDSCSDDDVSAATKNSAKGGANAVTTKAPAKPVVTTPAAPDTTKGMTTTNPEGGQDTTPEAERTTSGQTPDTPTTVMTTAATKPKAPAKPVVTKPAAPDTTKGMTTTNPEGGQDTTPEAERTTSGQTPDTPTTMMTTAATKPKVCETSACQETLKAVKANMDLTAKPCDDFSLYACGNFYKTAVIPGDRSSIGSFDKAITLDKKLHSELLEKPVVHTSRISFEEKMKDLYKECMKEDVIERRGLADYKDEYKQDWPTLNGNWNETTSSSSFDLQSVIDKSIGHFTNVLFTLKKTVDNRGSLNTWMMQIDDPGFMLDKGSILKDRNDSKIKAYEKYYKDFAMALGAEETTAQSDAESIIDLYREIAELLLDPADYRDIEKVYNPTTLGNMTSDYPFLNWTQVAQSLYPDNSKTIGEDQKINVMNKKYFESLWDILEKSDKRDVQNMFGFARARSLVFTANKKMRDIWLEFKKVKDGVKQETPRTEQCSNVIDNLYNEGLGKLVSNSRFPPEAKTFMDKMIANLKAAYKESFQTVSWMGDATRQQALEKLNKMTAKIGIPSEKFENADLDELYLNYTVTGRYNADRIQNDRQSMIMYWSYLNKDVIESRWTTTMTEVNAYNMPDVNGIVFPLGILQPPFFKQGRPSSMNYGAIGHVIGHEIGHGFDTEGRHHDERGRVRDWWTHEDSEKYDDKAKCYVNQYSAFTIPIGDKVFHLDGNLTKTENIADNLGLKQAYKAYKMYQAEPDAEDFTLPELELNGDQLFFLASAQDWCDKVNPQRQEYYLKNDPHSNGKSRINGPLQNQPGFAKAYNCPSGSFMNPAKRCTLW